MRTDILCRFYNRIIRLALSLQVSVKTQRKRLTSGAYEFFIENLLSLRVFLPNLFVLRMMLGC